MKYLKMVNILLIYHCIEIQYKGFKHKHMVDKTKHLTSE